ncbi:MAG: hypothetical protein NTV89_07095 [Proteobacteria bacterium]|nr:hypothetical protein [Pseudomonadota bacterium]
MLKKQKLLAMLFCCALVFGAFTATAGAQELAGTTYRLFMYTFDGFGINSDLVFDGSNLILTAIGSGVGSYYAAAPVFVGTYRALGATIGTVTGDISMYLAGATLGTGGTSMLGLGFATVKGVTDPIPFWFSGTLIATAQ